MPTSFIGGLGATERLAILAVSVPTSVIGGLGVTQRIAILLDVCLRGHMGGLSRCRLVGSCVLPGEKFFT